MCDISSSRFVLASDTVEEQNESHGQFIKIDIQSKCETRIR
jgi:hypothetical protein